MAVPSPRRNHKHEERPGPCPRCGAPAWWDGTRLVAQMVISTLGAVARMALVVRRRGRCSQASCTMASWTVYEVGGYPHRTFTLAVTAAAVAMLATSETVTLTAVAQQHGCDRRTVGRWVGWVMRLYVTATVVRACWQLDPTGVPPPAPPRPETPRSRAGWMLLLLEHFAGLLRTRFVALEAGPGLGALLRHQYERFRVVAWLTKSSPPLRIDWGAGLR